MRLLKHTLLAASLLLSALAPARAQLQVDLKIPPRLFIPYEQILCTVSVTNLAGRTITLRDGPGQPWFGFEIKTPDEHLIPPLNPNYKLAPLEVPAGMTIKRTVNLNALYPVSEYGVYRLKASIYFADGDRYFSSALRNIEVTEGKTIWRQTVGAPGEEGYREMALLLHRLSRDTVLYVRVQDKDAGKMYGTYRLGRIISGVEPQVLLDRKNELHVLQMSGPKSYIYTKIGTDGQWDGQVTYTQVGTKPELKKVTDGTVTVRGGQADVPVATGTAAPRPQPKLSDRPPGMPKD